MRMRFAHLKLSDDDQIYDSGLLDTEDEFSVGSDGKVLLSKVVLDKEHTTMFINPLYISMIERENNPNIHSIKNSSN